MVVNNKRNHTDASVIVAEASKWSKAWGSQLLQAWVRIRVESRQLLSSARGSHAKTWSFLSDPIICEELCLYLWSNKWSMNPSKLQSFINNEMIPEQAKLYGQEVFERDIPEGLKKYIEIGLFPQIHHIVSKTKKLSLTMAQELMKKEGFEYTEHKKALYFDGHERPDVVDDRQIRFLPDMTAFMQDMICYVVGDVMTEFVQSSNFLDYPNGTFAKP